LTAIFRRTTGDMAACEGRIFDLRTASVTLPTPSQIENRGQAAQRFTATSNVTACESADEKNHRLLFQQGSISHWMAASIVATARTLINVLVLFKKHLAWGRSTNRVLVFGCCQQDWPINPKVRRRGVLTRRDPRVCLYRDIPSENGELHVSCVYSFSHARTVKRIVDDPEAPRRCGRCEHAWRQFGNPGWFRSARWLPRFRPHKRVKPNPWLPVLLRLREAAHQSHEAATTVVTVVQLLLVTKIYVCRNINLSRLIGNGHGCATGAPVITSTRQHCQPQ